MIKKFKALFNFNNYINQEDKQMGKKEQVEQLTTYMANFVSDYIGKVSAGRHQRQRFQ